MAVPHELNLLSGKVVDAAIQVHQALGPGLLEGVYEACLKAELGHAGLNVAAQTLVPNLYRDVLLETGLRLDLLVEDVLVVGLKALETILPVHPAQLLSYMRLANKPPGLLINFNVPQIRDGITRIVNSRALPCTISAPPRLCVEKGS